MEQNSQITKSQRRNRTLLSCTECHRRKQKCDRFQPCRDCVLRGVPLKCEYIKPARPSPESEQAVSARAVKSRQRRIITGEEVVLSTESIESLANASFESSILPIRSSSTDGYLHFDPSECPFWELEMDINPTTLTPLPTRPPSPTIVSGLKASNHFRFLGAAGLEFDPFSSMPSSGEEPVPPRLLIHYFIARLAPWLVYLDDGFSKSDPDAPRLAWLPFAMQHKPLFHATMLTAVVHLNRRRPLKDPSAMIWFKMQTIKLANERMNDPVEGCTDEMIVVALVLCYFNVGGGNATEYEIHLRGIHDMVKSRGGKENLGMRGMIKNWLKVCYGPWSKDWEYGQFLY